jgi:hypothetical protein
MALWAVVVSAAACGGAHAPHAGHVTTVPTGPASTTTPAGASHPTSTTTSPLPVIDEDTLNKVAAELAAMNNSLSAANSDINSPLPDN